MPAKLSITEFITRASNIHNNLYDYSKVIYSGMTQKVCIIDPDYGEFWQMPLAHINNKSGHPLRGRKRAAVVRQTPLDTFIEDAQKIHNNLYDYSKVEYKGCDTKVCIIDPEYGEFWQSPYQHLRSHGCPARTKDKKWLTHVDHIIPLSIIHSSKRKNNEWNKERPLYKFLNSNINLTTTSARFNRDKSDLVNVNDKLVSASSLRNHYDIIAYLIQSLMNIDPTMIIEEDKKYVSSYFSL
jgi:hypothetical protein